MENILKKGLDALVPIYTEGGYNSTCIKLGQGEILMEKSVKGVLKDLCAYYHYDLKKSNQDYGQKINLKKMVPIPLTQDIVLIAIKTRSPIGKDDGALSYINIQSIKKVKQGQVYFKNGSSLKTLCSQATIEKHIGLAKLLKDLAGKKTSLLREEEASYLSDTISLRQDLLIIYKRLQSIEKRLFKV